MPTTKILDHEPTVWEKVKAFFGGYEVESGNPIEDDIDHLPDDASVMSDSDESAIDVSDIEAMNSLLDEENKETSVEALFKDPDDGVLDYEKPKAAASVKKVGFLEGLWNGIKGFFKNIFSSAPKQEPAPAIVKEEAPKVEEVAEEQPNEEKKSTVEDIRKAHILNENKAIGDKLQKLKNPNSDFVDQVKRIAKEGPDDVRSYLADVNPFFLQYSNDTMLEGLSEARQQNKNPDTIVLDMIQTCMQRNENQLNAAADTEYQLNAMNMDDSANEEEYDLDGLA